MDRPFLSLSEDPPPGFVHRSDVSARELRAGAFALFAPSVDAAKHLLRELEGKAAGVVVTCTDTPGWAPIAPGLYHLGVPPAMRPHLARFLPLVLDIIESYREQVDENRRQALEILRSYEDRQRLSSDFARAKESLLEEIRDRRAAEEALRSSEESYRLVVDNASEVIFIAQDERIKFPNPRMSALTGYTAEEIAREPFVNFIHPQDRGVVAERYAMRLRGEEVPSRYAFRVLAKSGETLWMEISAVRILWEGRPATLNFLRDITLQKTLEAQLLHSQKMEAVGTLAGGVAHDFNNLLQAISGFAALAARELPGETAALHHVRNIEKAAGRASELVRRLLAFSRREPPEMKTLDLNREIVHTVSLLERIIPKMVRIETRLADGLKPVSGDPAQIEQVVMNLGANARDAMPDGGRLTIETANAAVLPLEGRPEGMPPGPYVVLRVTDTGTGMDPGTMGRMFDPFFTTKGVGVGTGLGLSTVYGIVRGHGGWIRCDSRPGDGTAFEIFLPAVDAPCRSDAARRNPGADPGSRGEQVLLVDDEEMVRTVGRIVLERNGYAVECAASGEEALGIFRAAPDRFDIVILDLGMPGMGGRKCLEELRAVRNDARILVVSGYSEDMQARGILAAGAAGFLGKPYHPRDLCRTVRRLLDGLTA